MNKRSTEYSASRPQQQQAYSTGYQGVIDAGAMEHTHGNVAYNGYQRVNNRPSYGGNGRGNNHNRSSHMPNNLPAQHYPATHNPAAPAVPVWNTTNYPAVQQAQVVQPYAAAAGWQQPGHPQFQLAASASAAAGQPQAAPTAYYQYPAPGYHVLPPQHAAVHHQQQHLAAAAAYAQSQLLTSVPAYPPPPPQPLMPLQTHHSHQRHSAPTHHHHQQHPQQHPQQQQQQQQQQQHSQQQPPKKLLTVIDPKTNAVVDLKADTKPKLHSGAAASTATQATQQQPQHLPPQTAAQQQWQQPVIAVTALSSTSDVTAAAATSVEEQQQRHVQKDMLTQVAAKVAPSKPAAAVVPASQQADDAIATAKEPMPVKAICDDAPAASTAAPVEPAVIAPISETVPSTHDDSGSNAPQSTEQLLGVPAQQQLLRVPPQPLRSQSVDTPVSSGLHHSQSHGQLLELSGQSGVALPGQSAVASSTANKAPKYEFKAEKGESDKMMLERKQKYDRAFLFSLQDTHLSTQMPGTLDRYPELLRKSDQRANFQSSFMPDYVVKTYGSGSNDKASKPPNNRPQQQQTQQQQQGRASGGGGATKYYQQQQLAKPVVIEMRSREKVDLQHADNAYVPGFRQKRTDDSEEGQRSKDSERNIRSVLNKVTPQNFDSCFVQLTSTCDIGSASGLKSCVDIIFEKAIRETSYSFVFAEICKRLAFLKVNVDQDEESVTTGGAPKQLTYRGLLLRKCQNMFETPLLDLMNAKSVEWDEIICKEQREEKKKSLEEEKEEQLKKVKDQYYGNIRFIGELFMKDILTPMIIHSCIKALLTAGDSPTANSATQTEALECLCELLRTVGKKIESASDAKRSLDESFSLIDKIIKKRSIESKVRFKLTDIVEMRNREWELREMERRLLERPMTKEELDIREREREEAAQKLMAASSGTGRGRNTQQGYGRPPVSPSGAAIPPVPTSEWTPVAARRQQKMDTRKLILGCGGLADAAAAGGTTSATPRLGPSRPKRSTPAGAAGAAAADIGRSPTVQRLQGAAGSGGRPSRESSGSRDASPRSHHQDHTAVTAPVPAAIASAKASASLMHRSMSTHELPSRAAESGKLGPAILDKGTLTRKSKNIMDEWLAELISLEDTKTCFREIASHPHLKVFVETNAELLLDATSKELRERGGRLFFELLYCQLLGFQTVIDGFSNMMENADDWLADFPMLGTYLGEIFSVFLQKSASYLDCVLKLVSLVPEEIQIFSGGRRPLRGEILSRMAHLASVRLGHERVGEAFREAGVDWGAVLAMTPQEANNFVIAQELQFTEAPLTAASTPLSLERLAGRVQETVRRSLPDVDSDRLAESLIELLERGVPTQAVRESEAFNQELVRGICGACLCAGRLDTILLKRLCPVLSRFVEGFAQEVWSLKASAICLAEGQADSASDLLSELFTVFLDNRLVSEESFRLWYAEEADACQRGSVRTFMDTLVSTADSSGA